MIGKCLVDGNVREEEAAGLFEEALALANDPHAMVATPGPSRPKAKARAEGLWNLLLPELIELFDERRDAELAWSRLVQLGYAKCSIGADMFVHEAVSFASSGRALPVGMSSLSYVIGG